MAGFPHPSEGPGAGSMKIDEFPKLNPAPSARPSSSRAPVQLPRASSRGRSRSRQNQPAKQGGKGSLAPSIAPGDRGKQALSRDRPSPSSPAARPPQGKHAHKVFDRMPTARGAHPQGRSWAAVARSATKGYSLSYIPPVSVGSKLQVSISEEMLESSDPKWEESLVGYFIGKKLPFKLVEAALRNAWGHNLVDIMANDDGFYFFHLPDKERRKEILDGGPITVAKVPLVLQQWHPLLNLEKKKHVSIPIWVRLRNLPYSLWSSIGISAIASAIGKPLYVDSQTENMRMISYARVCVEVQAGGALPDTVEVALLDEIRSVKVEYEWKPSFCPTCMAFGHKCPIPQQQPSAENHTADTIADPVSTGSARPSPVPQPQNPSTETGDWIQVPPRKASTKAKKLASTKNQPQPDPPLEPVSALEPDTDQLLPPGGINVISSLSEESSPSSPSKEEGAVDSDGELSIVPSTCPEAECPAAPLRDTRRSVRSQVLGLPSSSSQEPPKPGDHPLNSRITRNRR